MPNLFFEFNSFITSSILISFLKSSPYPDFASRVVVPYLTKFLSLSSANLNNPFFVSFLTALTVADTVFMQVNKTDYKVLFPQVMRLSDRDINTIKGVLTQAGKSNNYDMCNRVAMKIKDVLNINSDMHVDQFLEKLLEDYNYLATKE